jgi:hypothetical protein
MKLRRVALPLLGFAVILAVCTGTVLAGLFNRAGQPESALRLSERELELPMDQHSGKLEDAPLSLRLAWRVESTDRADSPATPASATRAAWITRSALPGLDLPVPSPVWPIAYVSTLLVLEFDGSAHARAVSRACDPASPAREARSCEFETRKSSRLYVVDAGRSLAALRSRYPDRARFAIVPGVIKLSRDLKTGEIAGYVNGLSIETVQGLEPLRSTLVPGTGEMLWHRELAGRNFDAVIAFGRRLEPWNVSIEGRESEAAGRP